MEIPIKGNTWSETVSLLPKAIEISTQKTVYQTEALRILYLSSRTLLSF